MAMDERKLELQVGLLALLALLAGFLLWALFQGPWRGGSSIYVDLADSAGLTSGAPVKIAGVSVGRVRDVQLLPTRRDADGRPLPVKVGLRIDPASRKALVADARFVISSEGVLGEPYIEILPGSPGAAPLAEGAEVRGEDPVRIDRLLAQAERLISGLSSTVSRNPHALEDLLGHVDRLVQDADDTLRAVRPGLTSAISDASSTATEARALAQEARPLLAELREKLPDILDHASAVAARADSLSAGFSNADVQNLKTTAAEAAHTAAQLQVLLGRADRILAGVENGQGTIGMALKDPKLFEDLKAMVADLKAHPWKFLWK
ncbi:MAG TPA: MlaD family protein [Myxococcales bacterium]|nr:MlaD family protein [Myxococcales bacterium]